MEELRRELEITEVRACAATLEVEESIWSYVSFASLRVFHYLLRRGRLLVSAYPSGRMYFCFVRGSKQRANEKLLTPCRGVHGSIPQPNTSKSHPSGCDSSENEESHHIPPEKTKDAA